MDMFSGQRKRNAECNSEKTSLRFGEISVHLSFRGAGLLCSCLDDPEQKEQF